MHKTAQLLLQKIQYLIVLNRFKEAETYLHELLSQIPDHIHGLALLSLCRLNLNDLTSAIAFAKQSNAHQPNYQALVVLTIAYFYSKKYKDLKQVIKVGKGLYPYGYEFFQYEALLAKEQQQLKKATRIVEKGLQIAPNNIELHNLKGEILSLRGKKKQAKATFDIALSIDPNHSQTHCNQGWLALEKGHFQGAQHFFKTALRENPTDGESFRGLKLALKSEVKWFRPFIRYIAYSIKALPVLSVGILGGLASQGGNIITTGWERDGAYMLMLTIFLGFVLFFWLPFFLSALIGLKLAKQDDFRRIFVGEEKQFEQKHVAIFVIVASVFIGLLLFR